MATDPPFPTLSRDPRTELHSARRAAGVNANTAAEFLGVNRATLIRWESGGSQPRVSPPDMLRYLAAFLHLDADPARLKLVWDELVATTDSWKSLSTHDLDAYGLGLADDGSVVKKRESTSVDGKIDGAVKPSDVVSVVVALYSPDGQLRPATKAVQDNPSADWLHHIVKINGARLLTGMLCREDLHAIDSPIDDIDFVFSSDAVLPIAPAAISMAGLKVKESLRRKGASLWNDPAYFLCDISGPPDRRFVFGKAFYDDLRFSDAIIGDEANNAIRSVRNQSGDDRRRRLVNERKTHFPIRSQHFPSIGTLVDVKRRRCMGGAMVLAAFARGEPHNDFAFAIHRRSRKVGQHPGHIALMPSGLHAHGIMNPPDDIEVNLKWTALREIAEEMFGIKDVEHPQARFDFAYYLREEPMRFFRDHNGAFEIELVGMGIDATTGNYECAILVVVRDEYFWESNKPGGTAAGGWKWEWEAEDVTFVSTKESKQLAELIENDLLNGAHRFALAEMLRRLEAIAPRRVNRPNYTCELVSNPFAP